MIVCVCANVSDKEIEEMAKEGYTLDNVITETQACSSCGMCMDMIEEVYEESYIASDDGEIL